MATRPLDLDPMYQAPRPVESDWYAPRPTQTTNQAVNYSPFSGSAQDYAYGNGGYQGAADRATMAGVPTIGREAARLRPMGESVTTTLPGMAGYTRPQLDELRPLSREEMFFDRAAGATDPLEMQKALKGEASITLQKSDIDRVRAQRAAQNAPPRPMTDLMGAYGAGQRGYGAESAGIGQLSQAQQDFLAGKRQQQKSSPLPTPMEQREIARQREEARMEDQKNWIREYKTMETRAMGEEQRKTEGLKQEGREDLETLRQQGREEIANMKIGSTARRDEYARQTMILEKQLDAAKSNGDLKTEAAIKKDLIKTAAESALNNALALKEEDFAKQKEMLDIQFQQALQKGYVQDKAEWDRAVYSANARLISDVGDAIANAEFPEDADKAISTMLKLTRGIQSSGGPQQSSYQPQAQPQQAQSQPARQSSIPDTDGDGVPGAKEQVDKAMAIVAKGWNKENVNTITDAKQRAIIEEAIMLAEEVNRVKKANFRGIAEQALQ